MPGSARDIEDVLAACLDDLAAGLTAAQCLEHYPEYAEDLQPLLLIANRLEPRWPAMSPGAKARGRERMHRALDERPARLFGWLPLWEQAVALVLIIVSLAAAWLAWPGHNWRTLTPAAVPTASATPSPEPTAALPTARPLPAVAIPTLTPTGTTAAPRTATPAWIPTPTVEQIRPSATLSAIQATVKVPATPVSAPVESTQPANSLRVKAATQRAERPEPTTAPQETTVSHPTSAKQPTVAPRPQATPTPDEKQPPTMARPRATATPEHRSEEPATPVSPTAEPAPTRAAEHPTPQPKATEEPDKHEQKRATPAPEARPTEGDDEHHGQSRPEATREHNESSGEQNKSRK
jgi:hypothetical protein